MKRIICFGDSVTRGISFVRGRLRIIKNSYPTVLEKLLNTNKTPEYEVINKGVFNDNSDLLLKRLHKDVLALHPDIVLIEIGGNDCNFPWEEVQHLPEKEYDAIVPIERYINNIKEMVNQIKDQGATPVILTLLPLDPMRYYNFLITNYKNTISHWIARCGGIEHWHGMYNKALQNFIQTFNVKNIDLRSAFKKKGPFSSLINEDGIHPSEQGYQAIAEIIYKELNSPKFM